MKKKKEVTMWAIWCPNLNQLCPLFNKDKDCAWYFAVKHYELTKQTLESQGYHAVKGKFVWEEK